VIGYIKTGEEIMTARQATAEVFLTAFRALPKHEQNAFLFTIVKDRYFREDVIDLAIAVKRSAERCRNLGSFIKDLRKGRKN
jgi:hypothetical protein